MIKTKFTQIEKRDGRLAAFDAKKIVIAINKAFLAVGEPNEDLATEITKKVIHQLEKDLPKDKIPQVEMLQDRIEEYLMQYGKYQAAKAYIIYRDQHAKIRTLNNFINSDELMEGYLNQLDWRVRENSNMAYSLQGLNNHVASSISAHYWLNKVYPPEVREAHFKADLHLHDLQTLAVYCCGWDIKDILLSGFGGVEGKIESRPPKHFRTALGQIVNFFYTLQGEAAGAQALANFDTYLAPFIYYDQLSYPEVKQALQEFVFNMNVPTRVGFQTPFTNLTFDLIPSPLIGEEAVIIGGKLLDRKYKEFSKEMDMLNLAFAEVMIEGDAKGRVFTFPIPTYNITKDFDWNNPNYDLIWEMTAKYGIPYFSNFINSDMNPDDARSMCPLAGEEKVLIKSSRGRGLEFSEIRNIYEGNSQQGEYEIYSHGKFIKGRFNKFSKQKMIRVILENNHEIRMSEEHLNFVMKDEKSKKAVKKGKFLEKGMYLPYSLKKFKGFGGNYELGYFVGAFAGDGSFDEETSVVFSLENERKKKTIEKLKNIAIKYFAGNISEFQDKKTKLFTLKIHSRAAVGLCKDFVSGKERDKHYQARLYGTSLEFREGVVCGHYETDGGNRHRIYTSSPKMIESLNMLAATLGTTTSVYKDQRAGRFGHQPNYAVLIYQLNRKNYGDFWFKKGDELWLKIKEIKPESISTAYCFEVKNGEPVFTIGTSGILTHNCRLRLDNRELRKRGGGLFAANPLTGSIGVVTINLPRIGYLSRDENELFSRLLRMLDLARESLQIKREILEKFTQEGLYPYCKYYLRDIKARFGSYWKNHFNTIGINGMNECLINFINEDIGTENGKNLALKIMDFIKEKLANYQGEDNNLYNLEATPAEGVTYRFAKKDKELFADIIVANEKAYQAQNASPYYTNSTHLPVGHTDDIFSALDHQDEFQTRYTGGTVLHGYIGERLSDKEICKNLIRKIAQNYRLPYYTITPTFSICPIHGYMSGEYEFCPKCDEEMGYQEITQDSQQAIQF